MRSVSSKTSSSVSQVFGVVTVVLFAALTVLGVERSKAITTANPTTDRNS